jgi:DMSO/TMAO reductase YedYZ molybdopterin-dependent catalytic subunit
MSDKPGDNEGQIKEKLIRTKEQWAKDGRLLTGAPDSEKENRLPPGQKLVTNWPVLDLGIQPNIAKEDWQLTIDGLVENPQQWSFEDFVTRPQSSFVSDIHCVTQWSRYDNRWDGVAVKDILELVKPVEQAQNVVFHSYDGYTTNVTLSVFADTDVLLAHAWEGKPLSRDHGAPVRVIIPKWYFWKSAKWLKRIEFVGADEPGFWEVRGYHNEGDPWKEERYSHGPVDETIPGPSWEDIE